MIKEGGGCEVEKDTGDKTETDRAVSVFLSFLFFFSCRFVLYSLLTEILLLPSNSMT